MSKLFEPKIKYVNEQMKNWIKERGSKNKNEEEEEGEEGGVVQITKAIHCFYCFDSLYDQLLENSDSNIRKDEGTKSKKRRIRNDENLERKGDDDKDEKEDDEVDEEEDEDEGNSKLRWNEFIGTDEFPLFVTWNIVRSNGHPRLRGCIGNFSPSSLINGLKDYAIISALKDRRFSPVTISELKRLSCTVSLLHSFEDCESVTDWSIGTHGIYLHIPDQIQPIQSTSNSESITPSSSESHPTNEKERKSSVLDGDDSKLAEVILSKVNESDKLNKKTNFNKVVRNRPRSWGSSNHSGGSRRKSIMMSSTYLPEVASEQGWSKLETIDSAIRKAGWHGQITSNLRNSLIVERYQSSKFTCTFQDWKDWREFIGCPI